MTRSCLSAATIEAFLRDKLCREDEDRVLQHIQECPSCRDAIDRASGLAECEAIGFPNNEQLDPCEETLPRHLLGGLRARPGTDVIGQRPPQASPALVEN